jgi:hypothetical protein
MRYQLRYIRAPLTTSSPVAKDDDSPPKRSCTNLNHARAVGLPSEVRTADKPVAQSRSHRRSETPRQVMLDSALL